MFDRQQQQQTMQSQQQPSQEQDLLLERNLLSSYENDCAGQFADVFEDNLDSVMKEEPLPVIDAIVSSQDLFQAPINDLEVEGEGETRNTTTASSNKDTSTSTAPTSTSSNEVDDMIKPDLSSSCSSSTSSSIISSLPRDSLISLAANARRKRKPAPAKKFKPLPEDYEPLPYTILCGKGNDNYNYVGKF